MDNLISIKQTIAANKSNHFNVDNLARRFIPTTIIASHSSASRKHDSQAQYKSTKFSFHSSHSLII